MLFLTISTIGFGKLTLLLDRKINLEESLYGILGFILPLGICDFFSFFSLFYLK